MGRGPSEGGLACPRQLWLLGDVWWEGSAVLTCPSDPLDGWTERWIESKHKSDFGKFILSSGKFYGDQEKDKGKSLGLGAQIQQDFLEEAVITHHTAWVSQGAGEAEERGSPGYLRSLGFWGVGAEP